MQELNRLMCMPDIKFIRLLQSTCVLFHKLLHMYMAMWTEFSVVMNRTIWVKARLLLKIIIFALIFMKRTNLLGTAWNFGSYKCLDLHISTTTSRVRHVPLKKLPSKFAGIIVAVISLEYSIFLHHLELLPLFYFKDLQDHWKSRSMCIIKWKGIFNNKKKEGDAENRKNKPIHILQNHFFLFKNGVEVWQGRTKKDRLCSQKPWIFSAVIFWSFMKIINVALIVKNLNKKCCTF